MNLIKSLLLFTSLCVVITVHAQNSFWKKTDEKSLRNINGPRYIIPDKFATYNFDFDSFTRFVEGTRNRQSSFILEVPNPNGTFVEFTLKETPVFEEGLMSKYQGFTSFTGISASDPTAILKMSLSPFGINMMIISDQSDPIFIDPFSQFNQTTYIVYFKKDLKSKTNAFSCTVLNNNSQVESSEKYVPGQNPLTSQLVSDCTLRSYRLALSCTGEYAKFHGGTIEKVLAAYNASMTRVNGLYERDAAITMKLIPETDKLIFLEATTDPFSNSNGEAMLDQNQETIDRLVGISKYDIGHVFSTGGGGIAQLRSPCGSSKAMGVTGQPNPIGDPFDIDYVAHEMGHQFGANHTQNNSCQRNNSTAVEPGSASTIMGYAGICDPNVQSNSDAHFHGVSLAEIANFVVAGSGNTCAVKIDINNQKPAVSVTKSTYTIPVSTSFYLTAKAMDADGDVLTYCWEQTDNETATMPPKSTNTTGPAFRSLPPTTNPTRYFPDLQRRYVSWEVLPTVNRTMDFRCTVRDNNISGGCTDEANVEVNFSNLAGPFVVTYPNTTTVNWLVGSSQIVTWDVAKTDISPVNCSKVNIFLSVDGGISYPHLLAKEVPNTGSSQVITPSLLTAKAKIMVAGADNIFFDVSNANFRITSTFTLNLETYSANICNQDTFQTRISLGKVQDITQPILLQIDEIPNELNAQFSINPIENVPAESTITLTGLTSLNPGEHKVILSAKSGTEKLSTEISFFVGLQEVTQVALNSPDNLSSDIEAKNRVFSWNAIPGVKDYTFEISLSPGFEPILHSASVNESNYTFSLTDSKIYFWRVRANSPCVENPFSEVYTFRTAGFNTGNAVILKNEVLILDRSATSIISEQKLKISGQNEKFITITLTAIPEHGKLRKGTAELVVGSTFTMEDIVQGAIAYVHSGTDAPDSDFFKFNVLDDLNRWLPNNLFLIKIRQLTLGAAAIVSQGLTCYGETEGIIKGEGFGGVPPYVYSLDNMVFQSDNEFKGLTSGQYNLYIKDNAGTVSVSNEVAILSPAQISIQIQQDKYNINVFATGGTGVLNYALNDTFFDGESQFIDPGNGSFVVFVKDENGCVEKSDSIFIDIPKLNLSATLTNEILCASQKSTILCEASGGIPPYTFSSDGQTFQPNPNFQLNAGKYAFQVMDSGGKIITSDSVFTANPKPIEISWTQKKLIITINASGGAGLLMYSSNGTNYSENNVIEFPDNGSYKIYVKDENSCVKTSNISLNVLKDVSKTVKNVSCFEKNDGSIKLQPQNGAFPFLYSLNDSPFSSIKEWNGLKAGIYNFAIKDNKNDTLFGEILITQPDSLHLDWSVDGNDLTLLASGGTPPYLYSIDGGITFLDVFLFDDLPSDLYKVAVKDKNNCVVSGEASLTGLADAISENEFTIFPNPSTDKVFIKSNMTNTTLQDVQIFSVTGKKMFGAESKIFSKDFMELDIAHLLPGIYLLVIETNEGRGIKKIVKR